MENLNVLFRTSREKKGLKLREVGAATGIDQGIISKIEKGGRKPTEAQLKMLSKLYDLDFREVKKKWLVQKIMYLLEEETDIGLEVLAVAESRMEYLCSQKVFEVLEVSELLRKQLERIDQLKVQWKERKPLNKTQLSKMREFFNIEYTYDSNQIEGNTLSLQETQLVVNEGITISGKSMQEHLEAINHAEAIDFVMDLASSREPLNKRSLLELHALILRGIDKENAGCYRKVPVRISGSRHEPPQPYLVAKMMEDYFYHYEENKNTMHPILLAAEVHERLVSVHPFIDGNGRTARLVMNLILLRHGYTITSLKGDIDSRMAYYRALEKVQVDNEPAVFYELVTDAVERSLKAHLAMT